MSEEREGSEVSGHQRLDALRDLARQSLPATETAPQPTSLSPLSSLPAPGSGWRRWGDSAWAIVAAVVVVATIVGAILQHSGGLFQPKPQSPLSETTISISSKTKLYCPSSPVWSPDGKWLAVFGQTNIPTGSCFPYGPNSIAQVSNASGASSNEPTSFALAVLDSETGHASQYFVLLAESHICIYSTCDISPYGYQSLSWSPDGKSIAVFFTYILDSGRDPSTGYPKYMQRSGALVVVSLQTNADPRIFVAQEPRQDAVKINNPPSVPRFIWNVKTGVATVSAIPMPSVAAWVLTTAYATAYQWRPDGSLAALAAPVADTRNVVNPWRTGALGTTKKTSDPIHMSSSQWAWSPDGQFVTPNLDTAAYINLPGVIPYPTSPGFYDPPTVDSPSKALTEVISVSRGSGTAVEWAQSWDDALLASDTCAANGDGLLTIRALKSGQTLAHTDYPYPLTSMSLGCAGDIGPLVWSPNSTRIASVDQQDDQIILWQTNVAH